MSTRRYLVFDSGCTTCSGVASEVERETSGWVVSRSLREPAMKAMLDEHKPGWRWEPMLIVVKDNEVRVYTGLAMRLKLIKGLGPTRAWRVAQIVRRNMLATSSVSGDRRELLKNGVRFSAAAAAWLYLGWSGPANKVLAASKDDKSALTSPNELKDRSEVEGFMKVATSTGDWGAVRSHLAKNGARPELGSARVAVGEHGGHSYTVARVTVLDNVPLSYVHIVNVEGHWRFTWIRVSMNDDGTANVSTTDMVTGAQVKAKAKGSEIVVTERTEGDGRARNHGQDSADEVAIQNVICTVVCWVTTTLACTWVCDDVADGWGMICGLLCAVISLITCDMYCGTSTFSRSTDAVTV